MFDHVLYVGGRRKWSNYTKKKKKYIYIYIYIYSVYQPLPHSKSAVQGQILQPQLNSSDLSEGSIIWS